MTATVRRWMVRHSHLRVHCADANSSPRASDSPPQPISRWSAWSPPSKYCPCPARCRRGGFQQYLNAGLVEEFTISLAPVVLGEGTRLFGGIAFGQVGLEVADTVPSPRVTHLRYAVSRA